MVDSDQRNRLRGGDLGDKVYCGREYSGVHYSIVNHGWENNKREIVETRAAVLRH